MSGKYERSDNSVNEKAVCIYILKFRNLGIIKRNLSGNRGSAVRRHRNAVAVVKVEAAAEAYHVIRNQIPRKLAAVGVAVCHCFTGKAVYGTCVGNVFYGKAESDFTADLSEVKLGQV